MLGNCTTALLKRYRLKVTENDFFQDSEKRCGKVLRKIYELDIENRKLNKNSGSTAIAWLG